MPKFTKQQLQNWKAFEKVRLSGRYNMLDPRARVASGLDRDEHLFVIKNYEQLEKEAKEVNHGA